MILITNDKMSILLNDRRRQNAHIPLRISNILMYVYLVRELDRDEFFCEVKTAPFVLHIHELKLGARHSPTWLLPFVISTQHKYCHSHETLKKKKEEEKIGDNKIGRFDHLSLICMYVCK